MFNAIIKKQNLKYLVNLKSKQLIVVSNFEI